MENELLNNIKLMLGIYNEDQDDLLNLIIQLVKDEITQKTQVKEIPQSLLIQMAIIKYQRRGSECLTNASYSGDSETFNNSYPKYLLDALEELKRTNRRLKSL